MKYSGSPSLKTKGATDFLTKLANTEEESQSPILWQIEFTSHAEFYI